MTKKVVVLQDKMLPTGSSPVYDGNGQEIGSIHYHFFSLRGNIEVKDKENNLISKGNMKLISLFPKWIITDADGVQTGIVERLFSFFRKKYVYKNQGGRTYRIVGNIWDRKFKIMDEQNREVINVTTLSSIISLKPHTFSVELQTEEIEMWEAVNIVQGVRSLVKKERKNNASYDE